MLVALGYNRIARRDPVAAARISDGEPLPQSIVDMITCDSAIAGAIYGTDGAVLWQGRSVRLATDDQWAQLVDYWEDLGTTDIDRLVLVCPHDHHLIHSGSHVPVETDAGWELVRSQSQRRSGPQAEAA